MSPSRPPRGFLVMGVSGSGKSTFGQALATRLGWDFFDADDHHPPANIAKMQAGIPLDDSDRDPWLAALANLLTTTLTAERHPVLACSALKAAYRVRLLQNAPGVAVIYLKGEYELLQKRMAGRAGHFMKPAMLQSQLAILEEPDPALVLDVALPVDAMIDRVFMEFSRRQEELCAGKAE